MTTDEHGLRFKFYHILIQCFDGFYNFCSTRFELNLQHCFELLRKFPLIFWTEDY